MILQVVVGFRLAEHPVIQLVRAVALDQAIGLDLVVSRGKR